MEDDSKKFDNSTQNYSIHHGALVMQGSDDVFEQPQPLEGIPLMFPSGTTSPAIEVLSTIQDVRGRASATASLHTTQDPKGQDCSNVQTRSEKGSKARSHYRSSGYETESGESGCSISVSDITAQVSQQSCSDRSQSNLTNAASFVAQNCVENDFKPRSVSLYPVSLNEGAGSVAMNTQHQEPRKLRDLNQQVRTTAALTVTSQTGNGCETKSSKHNLHPGVTASSPFCAVEVQRNDCEKKSSWHSGATVGASLLQSQKHPEKSVHKNQCLPNVHQQGMSVEHYQAGSNSLFTRNLQQHQPVTNSRISDNVLDLNEPSSSFLLSDHSSTESSIGSLSDSEQLKMLEKTARCKDSDCKNTACLQVRQDMKVLQDTRIHLLSLNDHHIVLLRTMLCHMIECHLPKCPFPWCGEKINDRPVSHMQGLGLMKQRMENFTDCCLLYSSSVKEYIKLSDTISCDSMPMEGQNWMKLGMLGDSRKTVLAFPFNSGPHSWWVIKKIPAGACSDLWNLHAKLREVNHQSVITMLWTANFEGHLLICSQFEGIPINECLLVSSSQQIGLAYVISIMRQLISATQHLNSLRMVYLYWISKNVRLTFLEGLNIRVKLTNFSCSALLDRYDHTRLYLSLPPHIIPPELREANTVELLSDVWGLGCLLYELVTGQPVWHEHRHLRDDDLQELIGKNPVPETPETVHPELVPVFSACFQTDLTKRRNLGYLDRALFQASCASLRIS